MAYDESLALRVRAALPKTGRMSERKMFGGLAFMLNGHMVAGVLGEKLVARVGPEQHSEALRHPHARPMDITGKPMKGFVFVLPEGLESDIDLMAWVDRCAAFVDTLPPK